MWRQQHVVGHHAFTNLDAVDPDLRVSDGDVRCVTPYHKWHPYQVSLPAANHLRRLASVDQATP